MTIDLRHPREGWPATAAYVLLAVIVGLAYAALIRGQFDYGLEYDESYLLGVIDSIASGRGFVDDGVTFYTPGTPFHPYISTGPTLLLPAALVWALSDGSVALTRLVPISFFVLYLVTTALLLLRWRGRWAALGGLVGPLLLPVLLPDLTNSSVMPGRIVGEIAATALLVLMAVLLGRRRFAWGGLAGGLALLTKINFALPVVVLVAVWLAAGWLAREPRWYRPLLPMLPGLVAPALAFEAYKLASLGPSSYLANVRVFREFSALQTVAPAEMPNNGLAKLASLTQLLSGPAIAIAVVLIGLVIGMLLLQPNLRASTSETVDGLRSRDGAVAVAGLAAAALALLLWWAVTSSQPSLRPAVPAVMVGLSLVTATLMVLARDLHGRTEGRLRILSAVVMVGVYGVLAISAAYQGVKIARNETGRTLLAHQREAAATIIGASDVLPVDDFWTNPEFAVLTDLPFQTGTRLDPQLLVYTSLRALTERGRPDATLYEENCGEVLVRSTDVLVCRPALG